MLPLYLREITTNIDSELDFQRQNTHLLSLLPKHLPDTLKAEPGDASSSSIPPPPRSTAQLEVEIFDLRRENHALRYTFLGESTSSSNATASPSTTTPAIKEEEEREAKPDLTSLPQGPGAKSSDSKVDLQAVLQRVKSLFAENTELAGLLVGEVHQSEDVGGWAEVMRGESFVYVRRHRVGRRAERNPGVFF